MNLLDRRAEVAHVVRGGGGCGRTSLRRRDERDHGERHRGAGPSSAWAGMMSYRNLHVKIDILVSLRHALLGSLADQPRTGYALLKHFEQSLAYAWPASHSQIYPELARLLDDGLIEQTETGARNSKTYAVTDAGLADMRRWLLETTPDRRVRSDAALRSFFLWLLEPAEAEHQLGERALVLAGRARRVPPDPGRADGRQQEGAHPPHRARGRNPDGRGTPRLARRRDRRDPLPGVEIAGARARSASAQRVAHRGRPRLHRAGAAVVDVQCRTRARSRARRGPGARSPSRRNTQLPPSGARPSWMPPSSAIAAHASRVIASTASAASARRDCTAGSDASAAPNCSRVRACSTASSREREARPAR